MRPAVLDSMLRVAVGLLLVLGLGCAPAPTPAEDAVFQLDHLILGTPELFAGMESFRERTGVEPVFGGEHPTMGTHNALVSLGDDSYLEIIARRGDSQLQGRWREVIELEDLDPMSWAVRTTDMAKALQALQAAGFRTAEPIPGSRQQPNGETLRWTLADIDEPGLTLAPFLIEWGQGATHPSATTPAGCRLSAVSVRSAFPEKMRRLMELFGLDVAVSAGPNERMEIDLDCGGRAVSFRRE